MSISLEKRYETILGKAVRLYAIDRDLGEYCVAGAVKIDGAYVPMAWNLEGRSAILELSLQRVGFPVKVKCFINVYKDLRMSFYESLERADRFADESRIALLVRDISFEPGEGLIHADNAR